MSDDTILPGEPLDDAAAAALDFALGALDGPAFRAAELRLRRDPAFAAEVARWQADLAPARRRRSPRSRRRPSAWAAIERELFRGPVAAPTPSVVARGVGAALGLWRGLAFGASAVAAVALALLVARPAAVPPSAPAAPPALLAAAMASTDAAKAVLITATYDPARGAVVLTPAAKDASRGLTPELWIIVGNDKPQSLGVIDLHGSQAHRVAPALRSRLTSGATLAVSLEPAGGSPTGQPTGPVVAAGTLSII